MAHEFDDDAEEFDDFFSEVTEDDLTGLEPKFYKVPSLDLPSAELAGMNVADLITLYRDARGQLNTDRKGYKAREMRIKTHLSVISMLLRDRGDQLGVDSFATPAGTAFRNLKEKFPISDWPAFCAWLIETKNFQAVQKRTSPLAIKEIRQAEGSLPPGVDCIPEVEFSVRAPTRNKR
jgi:hypothetical protein